jgi:oxygen-independent coproporphyrinogen-3 oxidase
MVMALKNEWSHRADERNNQPISSLYFGGGTPSLLNELQFQELVDHIVSHGNFIKDFEFTVEVNPDDVNAERMQVWKKAGVNRLSVGIQSLDDHLLLFVLMEVLLLKYQIYLVLKM